MAMRLLVRVRKEWLARSPDDFKTWLQAERSGYPSLSEIEMRFLSPWIARICARAMPRIACVVASATAYVVAPLPVRMHFGVQSADDFQAHAWAEWPSGEIQLDRTRTYEILWTIDA